MVGNSLEEHLSKVPLRRQTSGRVPGGFQSFKPPSSNSRHERSTTVRASNVGFMNINGVPSDGGIEGVAGSSHFGNDDRKTLPSLARVKSERLSTLQSSRTAAQNFKAKRDSKLDPKVHHLPRMSKSPAPGQSVMNADPDTTPRPGWERPWRKGSSGRMSPTGEGDDSGTEDTSESQSDSRVQALEEQLAEMRTKYEELLSSNNSNPRESREMKEAKDVKPSPPAAPKPEKTDRTPRSMSVLTDNSSVPDIDSPPSGANGIASSSVSTSGSLTHREISENLSELRDLAHGTRGMEEILEKHTADMDGVKNQLAAFLAFQSAFLGDRANNAPPEDVPPPTGDVVLSFTDIQSSTKLWEEFPEVMKICLQVHNLTIRQEIKKFDGYEIKTAGDSFMVSFKDPIKAMRWCHACQVALLSANWPEELLAEHGRPEYSDDGKTLLWRGVRVRMGLHWGAPICKEDPVTKRMDYFGPVVNKAARVSDFPSGGQIILSEDFVAKVLKHQEDVADICTFEPMGQLTLKGIEAKENVMALVPLELQGRVFPPLTSGKSEKIEMEQKVITLRTQVDTMHTQIDDMKAKLKRAKENSAQLYSRLQNSLNNYDKVSKEDVAAALQELHKSQEEKSDMLASVEQMSTHNQALVAKMERMEGVMDELEQYKTESAQWNQEKSVYELTLAEMMRGYKETIDHAKEMYQGMQGTWHEFQRLDKQLHPMIERQKSIISTNSTPPASKPSSPRKSVLAGDDSKLFQISERGPSTQKQRDSSMKSVPVPQKPITPSQPLRPSSKDSVRAKSPRASSSPGQRTRGRSVSPPGTPSRER
eukprot:GFYU01004795.1.p1 GENE.GFYU01004795.1~~GFYU01004795.1.p1  ORF type:complete len:818 (-),score=112.27 GFYU01004795.1:374-2827(-)